MEGYLPEHSKDINSLAEGIRKFLKSNFSEFEWELHKSTRGSYSFTAFMAEGSRISVFVYRDNQQIPTVELYWREKSPSEREVSIKIAVDLPNNWEGALAFILAAIPVFSDPELYTPQYTNEELRDQLTDILHSGQLYGALLSVRGDRGEPDEEAEAGEIEYHEGKPDPEQLDNMINAALDRGDKAEFLRLSAMKESVEVPKKFNRIHGFNDFL